MWFKTGMLTKQSKTDLREVSKTAFIKDTKAYICFSQVVVLFMMILFQTFKYQIATCSSELIKYHHNLWGYTIHNDTPYFLYFLVLETESVLCLLCVFKLYLSLSISLSQSLYGTALAINPGMHWFKFCRKEGRSW